MPRAKHFVILEVKGAGGLEILAKGGNLCSFDRLFMGLVAGGVFKLLVHVLSGTVAGGPTRAVVVVVAVMVMRRRRAQGRARTHRRLQTSLIVVL